MSRWQAALRTRASCWGAPLGLLEGEGGDKRVLASESWRTVSEVRGQLFGPLMNGTRGQAPLLRTAHAVGLLLLLLKGAADGSSAALRREGRRRCHSIGGGVGTHGQVAAHAML